MDKLLRNKKAIILFMAPGVFLFTFILLIPIIYAIYIAFTDWNGLVSPNWVGFDNFIKLFTNDKVFRTALKNSIFFTLFSVVAQQILGMLLAVLLTRIIKFKNLFKNTYYLPCVLSSAALGLLFGFLFNPRMGVNQILQLFGIEGPLWLMEVKGFIILPMWVIAAVATWQYTGTTMMLYMAAIAGIPSTLYEASYIDGANKIKSFRYITMPLIKPMILTTITYTCIGSLKFFDMVWSMTQGSPNNKTHTLATHLYQEGFKYFKYGYASAIAIILLILSITVAITLKRIIRVENYQQ